MPRESKEIQEAKTLQRSLEGRRAEEKRPPDFKAWSINDLDGEIPGIKDAFSGKEGETKTCGYEHQGKKCKKILKRLKIPHPIKKGDFFYPWPMCECQIKRNEEFRAEQEKMERKRNLQRTYAKNIMAADLEGARLNNFKVLPGTETAHAEAMRFYREFVKSKTGLLFFGPVGNGKSHLARGLQYQLDLDGWATLFLDFPKLVELTQDTFNKGSNRTVSSYIQAAVDADLLVLDEIGIGYLTPWEFKSLLFPIMNGRNGKKTIFTTNLDVTKKDSRNPKYNQLEYWFGFDKDGKPLDDVGRLFDRIIGGCDIVRNTGGSERKAQAVRRIKG